MAAALVPAVAFAQEATTNDTTYIPEDNRSDQRIRHHFCIQPSEV